MLEKLRAQFQGQYPMGCTQELEKRENITIQIV